MKLSFQVTYHVFLFKLSKLIILKKKLDVEIANKI